MVHLDCFTHRSVLVETDYEHARIAALVELGVLKE
jgi:hypothetical protein